MIKIIKALAPKAIEPAMDFSKNSSLTIFLPIKAARQSETAKILNAQIAMLLGQMIKTIKAAIDI